jgi:hypothetical protein
VRKSADVTFGEVNVQSKNEVQLIFKTKSVHKQYHTKRGGKMKKNINKGILI